VRHSSYLGFTCLRFVLLQLAVNSHQYIAEKQRIGFTSLCRTKKTVRDGTYRGVAFIGLGQAGAGM